MLIQDMTASFGKLSGSSLAPQPGLNIIYAPNESGKSTWCHFIRTMLYGLPTRERGTLAEKNRFAPWAGAAMSGQMNVIANGQAMTIMRRTQRAASPMGDFFCTYSGTADAVPGITAQNLGDSLLGVSREVFVRSAFIGQSGLTLDKDAELERRIAALVTSGDESISFSETNDRLKKQLNRRKHNKTGLIPALEQEIAQLTDTLQHMQALHEQEDIARQQLAQHERQIQELQQRLDQWEALEKQAALRSYLQAQTAAQTATEYTKSLQQANAALPDAAALERMSGMADVLDRTLDSARKAGEEAVSHRQLADEARKIWQAHPFYPADDAQLSARLAEIAPQTHPFAPWVIPLALAIGGAAAYGLWLASAPLYAAIGSGAGLFAAAILIYNGIRCRRNAAATQTAQAQREEFDAQRSAYIQLQQQFQVAEEAAQHSTAAARSLHQNCKEGLLALLSLVQPFAPEAANLTNVRGALEQGVLRRRKMDQAEQAAKEAQLHCQMLYQHLPQGPLPDPEQELPRPTTSYVQVNEALPRAAAAAQSLRSQLDSLTGQLLAMGDRDALESRLREKQAELFALNQEYDAISMAMEALSRADQTLQNRFSPELGKRAAEIFSALTGGQYQQVFFDRSFALSASPVGDTSPRDIRLLSQGAADQLYLAVRLAICQLVLPQENGVPLILDDALANFDDRRMESALEWLVQEAQHRQILLFTCQRREGEYLRGRENVAMLSL